MARRSLRERNATAIATDTMATPATDAPATLQAKPLVVLPDTTKARKTPQEAAQLPARAPGGHEPAKAAKRASAVSRPAAGQGRLVLWTPEEIRSRMQAEQRLTGKRYLDQVLDAIEATYQVLPDLVAPPEEPAHVQGSIFERVVETEHAEHRVQLTIRGVLDSQLAVIDDLVASTGAGSRSALVNAALKANLAN